MSDEKNQPIAGIVKNGVIVHLDYAPVPGCPMTDKTYGMVCIKCNVCGRFKDMPQRTEAEVRGEMSPPDHGWHWESDTGLHHYFERHSSRSICGESGLGKYNDDFYEYSDALLNTCRNDFCSKCLDIYEAKRQSEG